MLVVNSWRAKITSDSVCIVKSGKDAGGGSGAGGAEADKHYEIEALRSEIKVHNSKFKIQNVV